MKAVILAGGLGTRISEESYLRPKPLVEIGGYPIIWHIMKIFSHYGVDEFVICCGYKGYMIKEYFADYYLHNSDVTFDFSTGNNMTVHNNFAEPWKVTLVDTGLNTLTGGRVKRIQPYVDNEPFFLTYGDGVSDVKIKNLLNFHKEKGKIATLTAVSVDQRFGVLELSEDDTIQSFREKSEMDGALINGGFMVLNPEIFNYIQGDLTVLEQEPLENLAKENQLVAYRHQGFWKCMDTQRDKQQLEEMWNKGEAKWKIW